MLAEQVTVTTTLTSLADLIGAVRGSAAGAFSPTKCIGIKLRYAVGETAVVSMADPDTVVPVVVLDAATEVLVYTTFKQFDISKVFLVSTGSVVVHVIAEQALI